MGNQHGTLAYLIETGTEFQPPGAVKNRVLAQVWPGVKLFLMIPTPISGKITSASGDVLSGVKIELPDFKWHMKEVRQSGSDGLYHLWVPFGEHKVIFKHGAKTKTVTLKATKAGS